MDEPHESFPTQNQITVQSLHDLPEKLILSLNLALQTPCKQDTALSSVYAAMRS